MEIRPIRTEADYRRTLREIETLMTAEPGTEDGDRLDLLVTLIEAYERTHFPMDLPDAVRSPAFRAEAHRQSRAVSAGAGAHADQAFIDAVSGRADE